MVISEAKQFLPPQPWSLQVNALQAFAAGREYLKADLDELIDEIASHLQRRRGGKAGNWLLLAMALDPNGAVARLKRRGVLRPSTYEFHGRHVGVAAAIVSGASASLGLTPEVVRYFESVRWLSQLSPAVADLRGELTKALRKGDPLILKGLTATLDLIFAANATPAEATDGASGHYSREELAEGYSYLCFLYNEILGLRSKAFSRLDAKAVAAGRYVPLLVAAVHIQEYREWEAMVDWNVYQIDYIDGMYHVRPTNERTEKATRLGFYQAEVAQRRELMTSRNSGGLSMEDEAAELYERVLKPAGLIGVKEHPVRRVVLQLPAAPALRDILIREGYFREEGAYITYAMQALLAGYETLLEYRIAPALTVQDLLRIARLVNIMRLAIKRYYEEFLSDDPVTIAESTIAVFRVADLTDLFSLVTSDGAAQAAVDLLAWDPSGADVFDVQYQPLIRAEEWVMVPMHVLGLSDMVRNGMQLANARIHNDRKNDPAEDMLASAFQMNGHLSAQSVKYKEEGQEGDVDVLAVVGDVVIACECKNSLLPASPFEMRTTLDHVRKAVKQLDRLCGLWSNDNFVRRLEAKTGLPLSGKDLLTCVVTANRMLSGDVVQGHPVRGLFEFGAFLFDGSIIVNGHTVRVRREGQAGAADLRSYLTADLIHRHSLGAMVPYTRAFSFGANAGCLKHSYALDQQAFYQSIAEAFDAAYVLSDNEGDLGAQMRPDSAVRSGGEDFA